MTVGTQTIGDANIQFFGKIVASLSHEIKNVFAIIHENAGLLEDLVLLTEKGRPLEPERIRGLAGRMRDQIIRGNEIVQNMNRFAHSADIPIESVDLIQTLELLVNLFQRPAAMKGITLETNTRADSVIIRTNPFLLENMIWLCVSAAMDCVTVSKKLVLDGENSGDVVRIRFTGLDTMPESLGANIEKGNGEAFLNELKGTLTVRSTPGELILSLPKSI
jgi:phosphoglycerate-specific signal transduction histidine kinase